MKDLFEEYTKVREAHPLMRNMTAYGFLKAYEELLTTEEIHILSRAHSASRAEVWRHDTESSMYEKKLLKERYNIGPEWKGPRCV